MTHDKQPDIHVAGSGSEDLARIDEALRLPVYIDPRPKRDEKMAEMLADPEAYFAKVRSDAETNAAEYIATQRAERERAQAEHARHTILGKLGLLWTSKRGK